MTLAKPEYLNGAVLWLEEITKTEQGINFLTVVKLVFDNLKL